MDQIFPYFFKKMFIFHYVWILYKNVSKGIVKLRHTMENNTVDDWLWKWETQYDHMPKNERADNMAQFPF